MNCNRRKNVADFASRPDNLEFIIIIYINEVPTKIYEGTWKTFFLEKCKPFKLQNTKISRSYFWRNLSNISTK